MTSNSSVLFRGFRATLPLVTGVVPFGVLYATIAVNAGFPWWLILAFSMIVFGGSSQLVFIDLFRHFGSPFQATLGSNIVNARHLIYSAGVSRLFSTFPRPWRIVLCYLLTDQLFAISQSEEEEIATLTEEQKPWYFLGSGACTWSFWVLSTGLGILFGSFVPAAWNLGFSIPLIFMPMLFSVCKSRAAYLTCLVAMVLVFFLREVPFGLGVFFSILLAALTGYISGKWSKR